MVELKSCTTNFFPELCGVNVVVDPQSLLGFDDDRILIIGQKSDVGTSGANTLHQVLDATRGPLFGLGSSLNDQITETRDISPTAEIWAYVLPNDGTAGESDIEFEGVDTATASGVVYLWVNGRTYQASFDPNVDTNAILAARFSALINANTNNLIATVAGNVLTVTTLNNGYIAGFLDVRGSYSRRPDQITSPEITVTIDTTDPTGLPDLSTFAADIGGEGFEFVINPYYDDAAIAAVSDYACSQWSGGSRSRVFGVAYGDAAANTVVGQNANNGLVSYMGVDGALTPPYLESASYGALVFNQLNSKSLDMAMSMTGIVMPAMLAPETSDVYTDAEKAALVEAGIGYFNVNRIKDVSIGRAVTTFTVADNGTLDLSLRDINKPSIIAFISTYFQTELTAKYTGYAFRRDGIVGGGSKKVATLAAVRNYMVSLAQVLSNRNLVQDIEAFIASLTLTVTDEGCIEISVDPELVDPFCCLNVTLRTL